MLGGLGKGEGGEGGEGGLPCIGEGGLPCIGEGETLPSSMPGPGGATTHSGEQTGQCNG